MNKLKKAGISLLSLILIGCAGLERKYYGTFGYSDEQIETKKKYYEFKDYARDALNKIDGKKMGVKYIVGADGKYYAMRFSTDFTLSELAKRYWAKDKIKVDDNGEWSGFFKGDLLEIKRKLVVIVDYDKNQIITDKEVKKLWKELDRDFYAQAKHQK